MMVLKDAEAISTEDLRKAVARTGMCAEEWRPGAADAGEDSHRRLQVWFTTLSGLGVAAGLVLHVWLAGGFAEALPLFAGHEGRASPWDATAAHAFTIRFGVRFVHHKS